MLKAINLAALGIYAGHHMLDHAVFAGRVHSLKNEQQGVAVAGVEQRLQFAQLFHVVPQQLVVVFFRIVNRLYERRPLMQVDFLS